MDSSGYHCVNYKDVLNVFGINCGCEDRIKAVNVV